MKPIPIAKPILDENEKKRVMEVLDSAMISGGKVVEEFESEFAKFVGAKYAVACSSGTTALHLALTASGITRGDKVLTTPFSFIATANSILYCGAVPVFCDVEPDTFNIDPEKIRMSLRSNPDIKALLIVHLFGLPCNMEEIMKIVKEYKLILIEDCAQSHGAYYKGIHTGNFGKAGIFSFYPTKNMTTAEGGMVITEDEEVYKKVKLLKEHGMSGAGAYDYRFLGYNYRMTNIEAAIGLAQLEKLNSFNKARARNAKYYDEHLSGLSWLKTPIVPKDCVHCYHQYTLKVRDRDNLEKHLKENGVGNKVFYPDVIPNAPMYKNMGYEGGNYPVALALTSEVISIPVHPSLSEEDCKRVAEVIHSFKPAAVIV